MVEANMSDLKKTTRFSMCSLYPRDERAICACFLGKDERIAEEMRLHQAQGLLWSSMGSGVISLSDLKDEIKGKRIWEPEGNCDNLFLKACHERGVKVFGVVFSADGYEITMEVDEDEEKILNFGKFKGKGKKVLWGLREFYQNRYPKIFKPYESFYSEEQCKAIKQNLQDSNFLDEAVCLDLQGNKSICYWVNTTGKEDDYEYTTHFMCKNSPLWMMHLKKIVEMQIDAGVDGIQFDEPAISVEVGATRDGFCKHCKDEFRSYLKGKYGKDFDYGEFLRQKGAGIFSELSYFRGYPYWKDWRRWLLINAREKFSELTAYTREQAKRKGKKILISANFFNCLPHHFILEPFVDVFAFEFTPGIPPHRSSLIYYEISRALADEKPTTAVPEISFSAFLRERNKKNLDRNLLKFLIAEASAGDGNFMIPYSCLTLSGAGAYYPPLEPIKEYRNFLRENENLFNETSPVSDVKVIISFPSYFWTFDFLLRFPGPHFLSLEALTHFLRRNQIQHELIIWGDGEFLSDKSRTRYHRVGGKLGGEIEQPLILPDVQCVSDSQIQEFEEFLSQGGRAIIFGNFATYDERYEKRAKPGIAGLKPGLNKVGKGMVHWFPDDILRKYRMKPHPGEEEKLLKAFLEIIGNTSLELRGGPVISKLYQRRDGLIVHLLNINYIKERDRFLEVSDLSVRFREDLAQRFKKFSFLTPEEAPQELSLDTKEKFLKTPRFDIYGILYTRA